VDSIQNIIPSRKIRDNFGAAIEWFINPSSTAGGVDVSSNVVNSAAEFV
jgi:hypothetical protein